MESDPDMKTMALFLAVLLFLGCEKKPPANPEPAATSAAQSPGPGVKPPPVKEPAREPTLADKVLGAYTHAAEDFTMNYEFLDNGAIVFSGEGFGGVSGLWSIENGEVVTEDPTVMFSVKQFFRIEANGDLTSVAAAFGEPAKRQEKPSEEQFTWKRTQPSVSPKAQAVAKARLAAYVDRKIRLRALKPTGPLGAADLARVKSFSSEKYEKDEPFYFAPEHSKMPYVNDLTLLAGLTKLEKLILPGNKITKLDPLAGLTELRELDLRRNRFVDLTPLTGLKKLQDLKLHSNYLSDAEVEKLRKALPNCKIGHSSL